MSETYVGHWTGRIRRGSEPNTVVGYIEDEWGWRIELRGTLNADAHAYDIIGRTGQAPEGLRIVAIDGERT